MIRPEVCELVSLGPFPASQDVDLTVIGRQEELLRRIVPPVSDAEAQELLKLFGPDDYYGGAWTMLHLIETAPHWPLIECLADTSNEWMVRLRERIERKDASAEEL